MSDEQRDKSHAAVENTPGALMLRKKKDGTTILHGDVGAEKRGFTPSFLNRELRDGNVEMFFTLSASNMKLTYRVIAWAEEEKFVKNPQTGQMEPSGEMAVNPTDMLCELVAQEEV